MSNVDPRLQPMARIMSRYAGGDSQELLVVCGEGLSLAVVVLLEERFGPDRVHNMSVEDSEDRFLFVNAEVSTAELADWFRAHHGLTVEVSPGPEFLAAREQVRVS